MKPQSSILPSVDFSVIGRPHRLLPPMSALGKYVAVSISGNERGGGAPVAYLLIPDADIFHDKGRNSPRNSAGK